MLKMAKCLNINRVFHSSKTFNQLTLVDVMCPVCRGIFIEPVTLPCRHGLCLKCFERAMDETSLTCPMCRKRVGGWLRTATKGGKIVNDKLWDYIKAHFPDQVQKKLQGEDDGVEEEVVTASTPTVRLSSPGEIRREYELQVKRLEEEARRREEQERRASEDLIRKLSEEEREAQRRLVTQAQADEEIARRLYEQEMAREEAERQRRDQELARKLEEEEAKRLQEEQKAREERDAQIARQLLEQDMQGPSTGSSSSKRQVADKENKTMSSPHTPVSSTTVKGPMDNFLCSKVLQSSKNSANCQRSTAASEGKVRSSSNASCGSHDSINQEMHHFKPIKVVPRTPPKRLPDGQLVEPKLIRSTPRNLNNILDMETPKYQPVGRLHQLRLLQQGKRGSFPASSAFRGLLSKNDPVKKTMISPEAATQMTQQQQQQEEDTDTSSFGLLEIPDVPAPPAAFDADLFYNPEVPVCIDYGQSRREECTVAVEELAVEADASLGYETELDVPGGNNACNSSTSSSSTSSSPLSVAAAAVPTTTNDPAKKEEGTVGKAALETILRITDDLHWELSRQRQQHADEELARRLHEQWENEDKNIDRSRDSDNPYSLRNGTRRKSDKVKAKKTASSKVTKSRASHNQKTIKEAFARTRALNK